MQFDRLLYRKISDRLFKGDLIVLYGPRQVGKTTLVKKIAAEHQLSEYVLCDTPEIQQLLNRPTMETLRRFIGKNKLIILDEAQSVENIGLTLKNLYDNFPEIQVIATGSSSFELSNKIKEPLTGRKWEFFMYPLSLKELGTSYNFSQLSSLLPELLRIGMYPKILTASQDELEQRLKLLSSDYLFKDILQFEEVKSPQLLRKLLEAVALQIGQEVSLRELGQILEVNKATVERYLDLLEKAFIIYQLRPLSRNQRNEISSSRKIYFYDIGLRNALIRNLNTIEFRNDLGALWENFCISERLKANAYNDYSPEIYFWRTYQQAEIDMVESFGGRYFPYEFKWSVKKQPKLPIAFQNSYDVQTLNLINRETIWDFTGV